MQGYTVIDLETTGFSPAKNDRIVEIAVVHVDPAGRIEDQWSTLVNPGRDVGPTHVHGITASDVLHAPTFDELVPHVLDAVNGRVLTAHNASFDLRFLAHELMRSGLEFEKLPLPGICTMMWSTRFVQAPSRRLSDVCTAVGIPLKNAHSAAADAYATAQLLGHYLTASGPRPPWADDLPAASDYRWPAWNGQPLPWRGVQREHARSASPTQWIDRLVAQVPRGVTPQIDAYLGVLEMALLDGFLAEHEKDELVSAASASGLTRGQVLDLHGQYLSVLAELALADNVVTAEERQQLDGVARMLGLPPQDVDSALQQAAQNPRPTTTAPEFVGSSLIQLRPGDRVVFTGAMQRDRAEWERLITTRGLSTGSVTKATRLVVASDPNSLSGKAAKARAYGVPVVTEQAFEQLFAAM